MFTRSRQIGNEEKLQIVILESDELATPGERSISGLQNKEEEVVASVQSINVSIPEFRSLTDANVLGDRKYKLPRKYISEQAALREFPFSEYDLDEEDEICLQRSPFRMSRANFEELMELFELEQPSVFPKPIPRHWTRIQRFPFKILFVFQHWEHKRARGCLLLPRIRNQPEYLVKIDPYVCFISRQSRQPLPKGDSSKTAEVNHNYKFQRMPSKPSRNWTYV